MNPPLRLGELIDAGAVCEKLQSKGLNAQSATSKADLFRISADQLLRDEHGEQTPVHAIFVPGRIEVLGKHTDYAGGRTVVVAADRGFCVVGVPREDQVLRITPAPSKEHVDFKIGPELSPTVGDWSNYPMTVARRLARNFPGPLCGADVAFTSDLTPAAGMSSSSAMMIATFLLLERINDLSRTVPYRNNIDSIETLGGYLATVENGQTFGSLVGDKGVGTFGGSEDHTGILCCRPNTMSQYSYCPVRFERFIPVPGAYTFAIGSSGVVAEKTGEAMEKYNRASRLAGVIARAWREATGRDDPHLGPALNSSPDAPDRLRQVLQQGPRDGFEQAEMIDRVEQFFAESEQIIPAAGDALCAGDLDEFASFVDRSQENAEKLLKNQVPETIHLSRKGRELGAMGATSFGAGFGGSVWAMVELDRAADFLKSWYDDYRSNFPKASEKANFFLTNAGPAAFDL